MNEPTTTPKTTALPAWLAHNRQEAEMIRFNLDPANRRRGLPGWLVRERVARQNAQS